MIPAITDTLPQCSRDLNPAPYCLSVLHYTPFDDTPLQQQQHDSLKTSLFISSVTLYRFATFNPPCDHQYDPLPSLIRLHSISGLDCDIHNLWPIQILPADH